MILIVDEEAQGSKEEFCSVDKLKREVVKYIDESVEEITIKKRAVYNNSQSWALKMFFKKFRTALSIPPSGYTS